MNVYVKPEVEYIDFSSEKIMGPGGNQTTESNDWIVPEG